MGVYTQHIIYRARKGNMGANGFACMGVVGRRCTSSSTAKQGKQRHVFNGKSRSRGSQHKQPITTNKPAQPNRHNQPSTTKLAQPNWHNQTGTTKPAHQTSTPNQHNRHNQKPAQPNQHNRHNQKPAQPKTSTRPAQPNQHN